MINIAAKNATIDTAPKANPAAAIPGLLYLVGFFFVFIKPIIPVTRAAIAIKNPKTIKNQPQPLAKPKSINKPIVINTHARLPMIIDTIPAADTERKSTLDVVFG